MPLAKRIFFSFKITEVEQNWEAVDGSEGETEKKHFFVNICHRVLQEGQARGCPEDAAACSVGELWSDWAHGAGFPKGTQNSAASGLEQVGESSCGFCRLLSLGSVYPGRGGK